MLAEILPHKVANVFGKLRAAPCPPRDTNVPRLKFGD